MSVRESSGDHDLAVVEAKRVDAEESTETTHGVVIPDSDLGKRYQLTDLVHSLYPDAEFRSYGCDVASFLAPKLLIVAKYRRAPGRIGIDEEDDRQATLFELKRSTVPQGRPG